MISKVTKNALMELTIIETNEFTEMVLENLVVASKA